MTYHTAPGVRATSLKTLAKSSPLHFKHAQDTQGDGSDDTASRRWLRAIHCAALEPKRFAAGYDVFDGTRGALFSKAGKPTKYGLWKQSRPGVEALTAGEGTKIRAIVSSLRAHPDAARILWGPGWSEVVRTWTDQPSGVLCKAQIDRLIKCDGGCEIWDLKTLDSTHPDSVRWMIRKGGFRLQLAHYKAGVSNCVRAGLIIVEDKPPHDVAVYAMTEGDINDAEDHRQELLAIVAECERSGNWPGNCPEMTTLPMDPEDMGDTDTDSEDF